MKQHVGLFHACSLPKYLGQFTAFWRFWSHKPKPDPFVTLIISLIIVKTNSQKKKKQMKNDKR